MNINALFDKYHSRWGSTTRRHMKRIDDILMRDELSGFTRLSDACRSQWISLFNALDMADEADLPGTPPYHRLRCLTALKRILGRD